MAKVAWGHLCDYAFFDERKKACLIGIFSSIFTEQVPIRHPKCAFMFSLTGEPREKVEIRVELVRPDGKDPLINVQNPNVVLTEAGNITNNIILDNLLLPDYGPYEIRIYLNREIAHTTIFQVIRTPKAKGSTKYN